MTHLLNPLLEDIILIVVSKNDNLSRIVLNTLESNVIVLIYYCVVNNFSQVLSFQLLGYLTP